MSAFPFFTGMEYTAKLKQTHRTAWFAEQGALFGVEVSVLKDHVTLTIDTTGPGLHKRGYRTLVGPAPLKETLAAALVLLCGLVVMVRLIWKALRQVLSGRWIPAHGLMQPPRVMERRGGAHADDDEPL